MLRRSRGCTVDRAAVAAPPLRSALRPQPASQPVSPLDFGASRSAVALRPAGADSCRHLPSHGPAAGGHQPLPNSCCLSSSRRRAHGRAPLALALGASAPAAPRCHPGARASSEAGSSSTAAGREEQKGKSRPADPHPSLSGQYVSLLSTKVLFLYILKFYIFHNI